MIKIGVTKGYTYSDVKYDADGWADAKKFIPEDFDLCHLKIKDQKTKSGWSKGYKFDGLRIEPEDEVLYWKKQK